MAYFWRHFRQLLIVRFDWHDVTVGKIIQRYISSAIIALVIAIMSNTEGAESGVAAAVALNFIGLATIIVGTIVYERTSGHYELMKVNGLNKWAYKLSFVGFGICDSIIPIAMNVFGLWISQSMYSDRLPLLAALFLVTVFQLIAFAMLYSLLFDDPIDASNTAAFLLLFFGFVYLLAGFMNSNSLATFYGLSVIPSVALSFGVVKAEKDPEIKIDENFSLLAALAMAGATSIIFFIEYLIFDAIKESKSKRQGQGQPSKTTALNKSSQEQEEDMEKDPLVPQNQDDRFETEPNFGADHSSAKYYEPYQPPPNFKNLVYLEGLSKSYGDVAAVDNLGLSIFEKEIFCLLGHNGAGKSTTINILTGLEIPDTGKIFYDGKDFGKHYEEVRTLIGLCAQNNLIFPNLSADLNLEFIGILRGLTKEQIAARLEIVKKKIDLPEGIAKTFPAGQLSGGQKRKLCLGMAIFGDPKIVFLDEPTSGMDPESRRVIWKIIRELRNDGKCIILTTHHLDEADELSDRIAVMVKGKIFVQGTKNYLKKEFGVGYHLVIQPKLESDSQKFASAKQNYYELVDKFIVGAETDKYTSENSIRIALPFSQQKNFATLFKELETDNMIRISLEMTSLEDAFVKIGHEEEKFFDPEMHMKKEGRELKRESTIAALPNMKNSPSYAFRLQFRAMFSRLFLGFTRNPMFLISFLLPIILLVLGTLSSTSSDLNNPGSDWQNLTDYTNISISINSSLICGFIVLEKERNIRYALNVMGCRRLPYWLGTYLFYLIIGVFWCFTIAAFFFLFGLDFITGGWQLYGFLGGFLLYFHGLIMMAFVWSFFFSSAIDAFIVFGVAAYSLSYIFNESIEFSYTHSALKFIEWPLRILGYLFGGPGVPLQDSNIIMIYSLAYAADPTLDPNNSNNAFALNEIPFGKDYYYGYVAMLIQSIWFLVLLWYLDSYRTTTEVPKNEPTFSEEDAQEYLPLEPEDVNREINRMKAKENNDRIKAADLTKVYVTMSEDYKYRSELWAVKGISFGVEKGQILGLLGPNGAGKSTTFNIVTGKFPRSSGKVELLGIEIEKCGYEEYQEIGMCPQVDFIWERLSVREHLRIFGMVKGLRGITLDSTIQFFCEDLGLTQYIDKLAINLSGGNKRKLCMACALIGSPLLQFFDEPSSGVDALGRRLIWDLLQKTIQNRGASSILTTHSMIEAESLCHKIGIIVDGKFVCFGTPQYLKDRYGSGYRISISRRTGSEKGEMLEALKKNFQNIKQLTIAEETTETFEVPVENFVFSESFSSLEQLKAQGIIGDFSIHNTTLEQIFIQFAKRQREEQQS